MKQTFLAPIEAPCWLRPAKTASGVLGCIENAAILTLSFWKNELQTVGHLFFQSCIYSPQYHKITQPFYIFQQKVV